MHRIQAYLFHAIFDQYFWACQNLTVVYYLFFFISDNTELCIIISISSCFGESNPSPFWGRASTQFFGTQHSSVENFPASHRFDFPLFPISFFSLVKETYIKIYVYFDRTIVTCLLPFNFIIISLTLFCINLV